MDARTTTDYSALPGLGDVYLEDSVVMSIAVRPDCVSFELDAVLRSDHPRYHPPIPGEQYCYVPAQLVFDGVSEVDWLTRSDSRFTDAAGETDLGNIDSLAVDDHNWYVVEGDWGRVRIQCSSVPRLAVTS